MFIVLLILLLIIAMLLLLLCFRLFKWTLGSRKRIQIALVIVALGGMALSINHFFFKNMRFIQSEVYPNLYLVKYPDKDYIKVQSAIKEKIKEHFKTENKMGNPLANRNENGVYFYELGGFTFGFIGEAGTGYFIDHEEDLGGFVSEELGMYTDYRLAEFYYDPCAQDSTLVCGEIGWYREGEFFKAEKLSSLDAIQRFLNPLNELDKTIKQNNGQGFAEIMDTTKAFESGPRQGLNESIPQDPEYYVLEVYNTDWDPNGINLRDGPNGTILKTLKPPGYGYIFSIVQGENEWFRVLKIDTVDDGELKIPQGILWIHSSVIGIRANWNAPILDTPQTGKQIGLIPSDKEIKIIDINRDWVKIEYQGIIGWVDSKLLCGNPVTTCP